MYNAAVWLQRVKESPVLTLTINWKYFSLEQVNNQQGPEWKLWEQPEDFTSRSLNAFKAAEVARKQGEDIFDTFHMLLLEARHKEQQDISDMATLHEVARRAGLDMEQFHRDISTPGILTKLGEDHTYAVEKLNVFGTPTLVFPGMKAVFLKMAPPPLPEENISVFYEVRRIAEVRQEIKEIKRP